FFFFSSRRRHTRSDRDWSSDVCSSDLEGAVGVRLWPGGSCTKSCPGCPCGQRGGHVPGSHAGDRPLQLAVVQVEEVTQVEEVLRSEERRVGKECRCGGWEDQRKIKVR